MRRVIIGSLIFLILCCATAPLHAETDTDAAGAIEKGALAPNDGLMAADFVIVRPVSIVGLFLGTAMAVVITPFAVASGTTGAVYKKLVVAPFNFAIRRPLGEQP